MIRGLLCVNIRNRVCNRSLSINVIPTALPYVFTEAHFNPNINLSHCASVVKHLFNSKAEYAPPADFKFALPSAGLAEFAFVGRSNAGKSSLVSKLLGSKKNLVRISREAGCTQSVNYFAMCKGRLKGTQDHNAYLVDLPGYGFANKSKTDQHRWMDMILEYFGSRNPSILRRIFIVVDARRGIMDSDEEMMLTLNKAQLPYQLVYSKSDLIKEDELIKHLTHTFEVLSIHKNSCCFPFIHVVSSESGAGIDQFKLAIASIYGNKSAQVIEGQEVKPPPF